MTDKHSRGRKPAVPPERVYEALEILAEDLFDLDGNLMKYSNRIWSNISNNLDNKISPQSLYIAVYQDRYEFQTKLRAKISKENPILNLEDSETDKSDIDKTSSNESETDDGSDGNKDCKKLFTFDIPYQDYIKMNPVDIKYGKKNNKKTYSVLKKGVWTNTINDWFIKTSNIFCNIMYKRCRIAKDISRAKHFLHFSGKCKDCFAVFSGWATEEPKDAMPLKINIFKSGVQTCLQHITKRPLNGEKRHDVGLQLSGSCASNWKRQAVSSLRFGDKIPPNVYENDVLWKCKQETKDQMLGITLRCPIMSLIQLKHTKQTGSIHSISADPFIVHYWTQCQLLLYKTIWKTYVRLSIDATGSIVKKIKRTSEGILSGHIFLYEAVVSNGDYQVSVSQMISEKQDTFTIFYWLAMWINDGVSAPQESVCDYSMALLGGITRAFCNGMSIRSYVDACIEVLLNKNELSNPQLTCFIRIDIAHLIKLVCRWKCWKTQKTNHLKEFFVRCIVLLVKCEGLDDFQNTLINILTVASCEYDGQIRESPGNDCPSEIAKARLINDIKGIDSSILSNDIIRLNQNDDQEKTDDFNSFEKQNVTSSYVVNFLKEADAKSFLNSTIQGDRLNAYYAPDFQKNLLRICKQFPLWSNVMLNFFKSPYHTATSASVEGDFSELKTKILKHDSRPMSADRFVVTHINSLQNSVKFARSKQLFPKDLTSKADNTTDNPNFIDSHKITHRNEDTNITSNDQISTNPEISKNILNSSEMCGPELGLELNNYEKNCSSSSSISSQNTLDEYESWKGLKTEPTKTKKLKMKKRTTKYTSVCRDIDRILNSSRMRSHRNTLILNGDKSSHIKVNKITYILSNTCPFDSLLVGITVAYNDYEIYKKFIDNSKNNFMALAKELALHGPSIKVYKSRLELLRIHFEQIPIHTTLTSINAECNVSKIIYSYLCDEPSLIETIICDKCGERIRNSVTITLPIGVEIKGMLEYIDDFVKTKTSSCRSMCDGVNTSTKKLGSHLFIETDIPKRVVKLGEIPSTLIEKYILVAVINYKSGHYTTYITRAGKSNWEIHNDMSPKIRLSKSEDVEVEPHALFYVLK